MIHQRRINHPMTVITYTDEDAREWVAMSLRREADAIDRQALEETGVKRSVLALRHVARAMGVLPGTIENLMRGRLKGLPGRIRDRIHEHQIRWLQSESARVEHELALAAQGLSRAAPADLERAQAALAEAKTFLRGTTE